MSRLTEPLKPQSARVVRDSTRDDRWLVFADGDDGKSYCIGVFYMEDFARQFSVEWNVSSCDPKWSRFAYREEDKQTADYMDRARFEEVLADNRRLRETCQRTLEELQNLKDAIREMEEDHRKEIRDLERAANRELTDIHREGFFEGREEARREFDDRDMEA